MCISPLIKLFKKHFFPLFFWKMVFKREINSVFSQQRLSTVMLNYLFTTPLCTGSSQLTFSHPLAYISFVALLSCKFIEVDLKQMLFGRHPLATPPWKSTVKWPRPDLSSSETWSGKTRSHLILTLNSLCGFMVYKMVGRSLSMFTCKLIFWLLPLFQDNISINLFPGSLHGWISLFFLCSFTKSPSSCSSCTLLLQLFSCFCVIMFYKPFFHSFFHFIHFRFIFFLFAFIHYTQADVNAMTDHAETLDAVVLQVVVGGEWSWKSSVMKSGKKTFQKVF